MSDNDEFMVFGSPKIEQEEIDGVNAVLRSGWLGTGPKVAEFEKAFGAYKGAAHPIAVNSCTAALHLSLVAAGIGKGDEVITTPLTFCATVNAIIHAGGTPVLADVDPSSMNISPAEIKRAITSRTRAILPVHFAGRSCEMDAIVSIARQHNLKIIEDCAHAIETEYKGRKAGTVGDFGCFSFYVTKNIVTGEGGMVLARNESDAARIKTLALHGMSKDAWKRFGDTGYKHYQVVECGFKYNMMDLQAVIGSAQLKRVEAYWQRRKIIWERYSAAFLNLPIVCPSPVQSDTRHAYHLFTILVDEDKTGITRDQFLNAMAARKIGVGVHYTAITDHPFYQNTFGWTPDAYPYATNIGRRTVSLPLSPKLTDDDVERVVRAVIEIIKKA